MTVDGELCKEGDADGHLGYLRIDCDKPMLGKRVRLQLLTKDFLNLQYVGVEGSKAPDQFASSEFIKCMEHPYSPPSSTCRDRLRGEALSFLCGASGNPVEGQEYLRLSTPGGEKYDITSVSVQSSEPSVYEVTVDGVKCASNVVSSSTITDIPCSATGSAVELKIVPVSSPDGKGSCWVVTDMGVKGTKATGGPAQSAPAAPASKPDPTRIAMANAKLSSDFSPSSNPLPYPAENCLEDRGTTPEELNANMCVSNSQPNPWWQASSADGRTYHFTKVIVRNRADCLGTCRRVRSVRGGPISSARDTLTPSTHERAHVDQGCARTASGTSF